MLVKVRFTNKTVVGNSKQEIYNNEDKHTPSLNASTEKKGVKEHTYNPWAYHGVVLHHM